MNHIVSRAKDLETLIVDFDETIPNFYGLINNLVKIKFLEISNIDENYLDFSYFKGLEILCLGLDYSVNFEILQTLKHCSKLKAIDIYSFKDPDFNHLIALKDFKCLEFCHFGGFQNINFELITLVQSCQLKYLSLSKCQINKDVLKFLLTECDSLTHLELTKMWRLNYKTIKEVLEKDKPHRLGILKLVIEKSPFKLPICKWCEIIEIEKSGPRLFSHFTDVKKQYQILNARN